MIQKVLCWTGFHLSLHTWLCFDGLPHLLHAIANTSQHMFYGSPFHFENKKHSYQDKSDKFASTFWSFSSQTKFLFINHIPNKPKMSFEAENKIFDIHSAFQFEYSQAKTCLAEFYEAVSKILGIFCCWPYFKMEIPCGV